MFIQAAAQYIANIKYEDLPGPVTTAVKWAFLDTLSVAVSGASETASQIICDYVRSYQARGSCHVMGMEFTTYPAMAAMANASIAHALDADDTEWDYIGHPSAVIVPVAIAMGEYLNASGRDLIAAYVAGYEFAARIGIACGNDHYDLGWHNTSTIGCFAACACAARLMNLTVDQTEMAISIAASLACGTQANFGTYAKCFHVGAAARNGIEAALLAQRGFTGTRAVFNGKFGFCTLFGAGKSYDLDAVLVEHPFNKEWRIVNPGLVIKPYPCCTSAHPSIDAVYLLKQKYDFVVEDVLKVECETSREILANLSYHDPQNCLQAKFSLEYCVARSLLDDCLSISPFTGSAYQDPKVKALMERIVYIDPTASGFDLPQTIRIFCKDGRVLKQSVGMYEAKGQINNPFTIEDLKRKCSSFLVSTLDAEEQERFFQQLLELDHAESVRSVMPLICRSV